MERNDIYNKISIKRAKGVEIKHNLCFYNPQEVYKALTSCSEVKRWLEFISNHYDPPTAKVFLFYPCSADKPYYKSRSYKILYNTLSRLGKKRKEVYVITISEPFGLIPQEFYYSRNDWHDWETFWYDCPGLFEWWCKKYGQPYSREYLEKCIELLASYVAKFLTKLKNKNRHSKIIAFVRTFSSSLNIKHDHTHRRIIEIAMNIANVKVNLLPPKRVVAKIVSDKGRLAWDMYGVAHPLAQNYLLHRLKVILSD